MKLGYLLAFGGGVLVAGVAMMMLAPKSGEEACVNFRRKMEDMKRCVGDAVEEALKKHQAKHGKMQSEAEVITIEE
ncbi:MAG: YtxH domain-containing protein [Bacteroidaceae bacterium]|nr:YtxH domain-containing protein [Bacteroidaceae bacterium]